jgi:hypothetical protein
MGATLLLAVVVTACAPAPEPRTALDFMEDGLAREGVLARCNRDRDRTLDDEECANARRAAVAVAIEAERARAGTLERQSERKLAALREAQAREAAAAREGAAAQRAAAEAAYEAQWPNSNRPPATAATSGASFGAPLGAVLPSMSESTLFEVYPEGTDPLGRPGLELEAAEPPANEVEIVAPQIELADVAAIPRPFRAGDANAPR